MTQHDDSASEPSGHFEPLLDQRLEQRQEYRLTGRVRVIIETEATEPDAVASAQILECFTSDISANGLRVNTPEPMQVGALLPVTVVLTSQRTFTVIGEVMWCRPEGERYLSGFKVYESDDESVYAWKEAVAKLLES